MIKIFLTTLVVFLSGCSSITLRKSNYKEKWSKTLSQQLTEANPGYNFTMVQGPTDTLYFEGMSGLTFTGSYTKDKLVVDYDYYFESYNGQFISYTWTGPTNSGYSRQVTPTASGLQLDIGYKIFSFLKPYIGLRSHTMNYGSSIMTTGNGFSYVEFYDNKKYVTAGVEIYYKFTKSLGLVISPEYSRAITLPSPMESGSLVTVTGGLRWDLDKVK